MVRNCSQVFYHSTLTSSCFEGLVLSELIFYGTTIGNNNKATRMYQLRRGDPCLLPRGHIISLRFYSRLSLVRFGEAERTGCASSISEEKPRVNKSVAERLKIMVDGLPTSS